MHRAVVFAIAQLSCLKNLLKNLGFFRSHFPALVNRQSDATHSAVMPQPTVYNVMVRSLQLVEVRPYAEEEEEVVCLSVCL